MGRVFRNQQEIPIPDFAYVNASDGRVFTIHRDERNKRQHITIGWATSKVTMHPNENFKFLYPKLWAQYYGESRLQPHELHVGLYGLILSAGWKTGLYPMLQKDFGPLNANAVLDDAMFSIRHRADSTDLMKDEMAQQLLFSDSLRSDSWYSDFFENQLSADIIHQFRMDWLKRFAVQGGTKVWLCIDGTNNDCTISESRVAEPGNSKSHKAVNIYSYMWAVSSKDGRPVTWFLNNGGKVDAKAFEKMIRFLAAAGIEIEGVILDRGFAAESVMGLIRELGYRYVVMLKSSALAYKTMLEKYAETIRWKVAHVINEKGIFGVEERTRVFASGTEEACVGLFFDGIRGCRKSMDDIARVLKSQQDIKAQIIGGKKLSKLKIASDMKPYLKLTGTADAPAVELCTERLQESIDRHGFNAIASSEDLPAERISEIYDYRDISEKQFSALKSQLGADVTRVHDDQHIEAKLAICFIAAVIRTEIELACRKLELDTNKSLREADRTVLTLMPNDEYCAVHDYSKRMALLYAEFGLSDEHLDFFAQEVNGRRNPVHSQTRTMPPFLTPAPKRKPGRPAKKKALEDTEMPKRKPGRPKGSKNKKTLEREALLATMPAPAKRKPGRPKGSKNKKTLEREALLAAPPKRGRGRPKGSKNKSTLEREKREAQEKKSSKPL